ncbi:conserved hypothetical protein [Histoplasma capsulatum G186AR]|uniref:DUF7707 domain-containing protein n=2 Tax=Ajellomyces capsulatus TaxID=5037 RepID=C0NWP5_AJECG|nr:uncharacterized protein HCBG_07575 [Histoplasma capsulatum G186AR]EEH04350.1 conserved hypothetical protein [Histoplasma capsulatum G186AR]KAG5291309.1 hypothetical protein I7I52_08596 [Histoplasma capsulatum]QSS68612.1 hypothetical protein I7I50_08080 [Histoplasma capsulatum G186AR]
MLLSAIVFAVSLLVSGIQAQSFDPQSVSDDLKLSWCDAQLAACPKVCKSFASVNKCDANDLSFTCTCGDGSTPDLTKYMNTIPYFICTATYGQCVKSHPDDLSGQRVCKTNQTKCLGTIDPLKSATTTSQIEQTSAAKPTGKPTVTPTTTSEPAATTTSNPASTLRIPGHSSMGIMVALFLAAFKFFI